MSALLIFTHVPLNSSLTIHDVLMARLGDDLVGTVERKFHADLFNARLDNHFLGCREGDSWYKPELLMPGGPVWLGGVSSKFSRHSTTRRAYLVNLNASILCLTLVAMSQRMGKTGCYHPREQGGEPRQFSCDLCP